MGQEVQDMAFLVLVAADVTWAKITDGRNKWR